MHLTGYSLENYGTLEIVFDGYLYNHTSFVNYGTLTDNEGYMLNDVGAQLTIASGASFELLNDGNIQSSGTISNFGSIFNNFGYIENAGLLDNYASIITIGTCFNFGAGRINNYPSANLTSDGDFFNYTVIDNLNGAVILNSSVFENNGVVYNCVGTWEGTPPIVNPLEETTCPDQEMCDGIDNDLDGEIDEACGCTNPLACNFTPYTFFDDGSCSLPDGCTNSFACNYTSAATCDDGSCILPDGCTDPTACNFNAAALCDDGSCNSTDLWHIPNTLNAGPIVFSCDAPDGYTLANQVCAQAIVDNDPYCLDTSWDSICQSAYNCCVGVPPSCYNASACNFDPLAISCQDESTCTFPGCTNPAACNYRRAWPDVTTTVAPSQAARIQMLATMSLTAICDDGNCNLPGCTDPLACNFDLDCSL